MSMIDGDGNYIYTDVQSSDRSGTYLQVGYVTGVGYSNCWALKPGKYIISGSGLSGHSSGLEIVELTSANTFPYKLTVSAAGGVVALG